MSAQAQLTDAVHEAARKAYSAGLTILPPVEDGSKRPQPDGGGWQQFKVTRPSADLLRKYYPGRLGLGVIAVDGVECWDFDDAETYAEFLEAARATGLGAVVERIERGYADATPGGGTRWLVHLPIDTARQSNCKLARRPKRPEERKHEHDIVKVLIELPDYAIVAPTGGRVHPSGLPYRRRSGDFDTIATITADERVALLDLARSFDQMPRDPARTPDRREGPDRSGRPGDAFNARTSWPEILEPHGWRRVHSRGGTDFWRRPGKDYGISATTNHADSDLLWVFSSSSVFEPERSYDRFGAYALLQHGGDFQAATRALGAQGYGDSPPARSSRLSPWGPNSAAGAPDSGVRLDDFHAYMPMHSYIFAPSRELWPAASVNARIAPILIEGTEKSIKATDWLDQHQAVEQMTWAPGLPLVIRDRLVSDGGWIDRPGCATFNLYRPPRIEPGDPRQASRWLEHVHRVYPEDAAHIVAWLAHRVQRPQEKINHALVLGGLQGVGKDTLLEPVKQAIGPWNFLEVSPTQLLGRFNGFVKSVILRVSEARDLGDVDRYAFYDHMKVYTAAPPDVLRVDEKHLREYAVWNVCGIVITTNHKTDGLYLPADDRRHYVAWSELAKDDFAPDYWTGLYGWYHQDGARHVTAYLAGYDLSGFDPKAAPAKTAAFWDVVDANRAPEDAELADTLEALRHPDAVTLAEIASRAPADFAEWLRDRKAARQIPYRMESAGYVHVRNPSAKDGLWRIGGKRQVVYAKQDLPLRDRIAAAQELDS